MTGINFPRNTVGAIPREGVIFRNGVYFPDTVFLPNSSAQVISSFVAFCLYIPIESQHVNQSRVQFGFLSIDTIVEFIVIN